MKVKSAAGAVIYVTNLKNSIAFYEQLGFNFKRIEDDRATGYVNWFWLELLPGDPNNSSQNLYFSVDKVDDAFQELQSLGYKCNEPLKTELGNKELQVFDPDNNSLFLFNRL